ncbi:MAG: DNA translocase FtsK [Chloroflexi bacterium OLB15]|nr:MAG: DNA translocase FtsK [Chloroflexi bacterium OLB15]
MLEIIGIVVVMLGGAMLLASLSPSPGSLIDTINGFVSRVFGWGAIFVPIAMIPTGIWMVTLRVGQETPSIDITRIVGLILLFLSVLAAMQFFDALSYPPGENQSYPDYMLALRNVLLPLSSEFGRGGGRVGGEIYYFLVSNFSELAGFVMLIGLLLIALMLTFSISAQEVIAILVGNWRNLRDAYHRRTVRVRAQRAEKAAALAASTGASGDITVSRPDAGALPPPAAGNSPALPAGAVQQPLDLTRAEERSIPITMGGRTFTTPINTEAAELVPVGTPEKPASSAAAPSAASGATPDTTAAKEQPAKGGLFGRMRNAVPLIGSATVGAAVVAAKVTADALTPDSDAKEAEAAAAKPETSRFGGIGGRLFNRTDKPAAAAGEKPATSAETTADAQTANSAAAVVEPAATLNKPAENPPARLGDLARPPASPAAPTGARPAPLSGNGQAGASTTVKPASPISPVPPGAAAARSPLSPVPPSENDPLHKAGSSAAGQPASPAASTATETAGVTPKPTAPVEPAKTEDSKTDKPASTLPAPANSRPLTPMQPVRSTGRNPFHNQSLHDPESPDDLTDDDDADSEDWSRLPPARPKVPGTPPEASRPTVPPPAHRDPIAPPAIRPPDKPADPAKRDEESIPDLQTRLQALRNMQVAAASSKPAQEAAAPTAPKADAEAKDKPEEKNGSNLLKTAGVIAAGAVGAAVNKLARPDDDDEEVLERPPAVVLPKPEARTPSAAYGKPDDGIRDPSGAMATSRSAPFSSPRPFASSGEGAKPPVSAPTPPAASQPPAQPVPPSAAQPQTTTTRSRKEWRLPQMPDLLSSGLDQELDKAALVRRAKIIEDTLSSFGAPGRVVEVRTGPVITQFGVEPDYVESRGGKKARVKVSAIATLDKDLQLALGAKSIRIEAPVPGKGYVGIEVPNEKPAVVKLRDVMESQEFRKIQSPLAIALGQGVDGTPVAADLASMPHLLIAGTTGSGKSVCVNTIIASLLLRNSPDRVKLIMVDPKRVELTGYNGIPHLIAPVVVELERIVSVLKWVTREMDERYRRFALASARNIEDYNKHLPSGEMPMPYIVLIIDELADLMMLAPDETEKVITRLAALARATGIHLVIATQRPSVDVVTGLIKANFPARIAFAVAGGVDSRVILDQPGAEKLLGRGDMLYMSGDAPAPLRLQGVFVSDTEISNITRFWRNQMTDADMAQAGKPLISQFALDEMSAKENKGKENGDKSRPVGSANRWDNRPPSGQSVFVQDDEDSDEDEDELYEQAVDLVRRQNKASVSLLQRRFRIGYTRAARLMDVLEERGIVGPPVEGAKPREVLPPK